VAVTPLEQQHLLLVRRTRAVVAVVERKVAPELEVQAAQA
jgi:hypothetical protein